MAIDKFIAQIKKAVRAGLKLSQDKAELLLIESAPSHIEADLALNIFRLAKVLKRSPTQLALKIAAILKAANLSFIATAKAVGSFVNVELTTEALAKAIEVKDVKINIGRGKLIVIEYSSPNIAKPMGVGHLRSTIIGQTLANIYQTCGFKVVRLNYLGDWGTQFGNLLYAFLHWAKKKKHYNLKALQDLYVKFHAQSQRRPALAAQGKALFARLERGDKKLKALWKKFKRLSITEFKKIYQLLGVKFDYLWGESSFVKEGDKAIAECLAKNICSHKIDGAVAVEKLEGLPSFLLRKADGSTLYLTRDLASLKYRIQKFKPAALLYVVGQEQELHFKQLFALAKVMDYLGKTIAKHISFGLVLAAGKKMATRQGSLVELENLINQANAKSKKLLLDKSPKLPKKQAGRIAEILGIGAIIYNDLRQSRQLNISFDWQRMLNFQQGSAIYVQYTAVRINSLLKKARNQAAKLRGQAVVLSKREELALARKLMFFPLQILAAQKNNSPHIITTYLEELAQLFNNFYQRVPVLRAENELARLSRLILVKKTGQILTKGLELLNIKIPSKM